MALAVFLGMFTCSSLLKVLLLRSNMEREICGGPGYDSGPRQAHVFVFILSVTIVQ